LTLKKIEMFHLPDRRYVMNLFKRFALCLLVLVLAVGCASTEVTKQSMMSAEEIARPDRIYVYPFASTPADIPSWSAAAGRYAQPSAPPTSEELAAGRELGVMVAKELVTAINKMGLRAIEGNNQSVPEVNDGLLIGYFEAVEEGSAAKRMIVGFGSGSAEAKTVVEGYQMTPQGPRMLGAGEMAAGGNKTPGLVVPLAVYAATSNPIGLIVMGSTKTVGEATGKNTIEGTAKRTAEVIAGQLRERFKKRGWIR
jgi:Domain of unknown function (DUF4410)